MAAAVSAQASGASVHSRNRLYCACCVARGRCRCRFRLHLGTVAEAACITRGTQPLLRRWAIQKSHRTVSHIWVYVLHGSPRIAACGPDHGLRMVHCIHPVLRRWPPPFVTPAAPVPKCLLRRGAGVSVDGRCEVCRCSARISCPTCSPPLTASCRARRPYSITLTPSETSYRCGIPSPSPF